MRYIDYKIIVLFSCLVSCQPSNNESLETLNEDIDSVVSVTDSTNDVINQDFTEVSNNTPTQKLDTMTMNSIYINDLKMGEPKSKMINRFGVPDSSIVEINEFTGEEFESNYYGDNIFYVDENKFSGFEIVDERFKLGGDSISIGQSKSVLLEKFPNSYNMSKTLDSLNFELRVNYKSEVNYIRFIVKDGVITTYFTWERY